MLGSGEEGLQMLLLSYFWHMPGVTWEGIAPIPGLGRLQPWERSGDEALTHADLAAISVPPSKTKVQGNSLVFHSTVASLHLWDLWADNISPEPFAVGWEQLLAGDSESLRSPRCTQTGSFSQAVIAIRARPGILPQNVFKWFKARILYSDAWTRGLASSHPSPAVLLLGITGSLLFVYFFLLQPFVKISLLPRVLDTLDAPHITLTVKWQLMILAKLYYRLLSAYHILKNITCIICSTSNPLLRIL